VTQDPDLIERIRARRWFHTIDLGDGLVTNGDCPPSILSWPGCIPDVRGKTVLDIGTWDGKYSFEAERAGAARVVALDHYVWKLNAEARQVYYDKCEAEGVLPDPKQIDNGFLTEDSLPGKAGFDMAHQYLDSKVEAVVGDFMTIDLDQIGTFDVVFYFGVLYHMVDPMGGLERLRRVTKEMAVVETAGIAVPGYPETSLIEFHAGNELGADYGNWFVPSERALHAMCRAVGFRRVETRAQTAINRVQRFRARQKENATHNCRIVVQAFV
jgi:tRNA (mo5U34)-methyltransferase